MPPPSPSQPRTQAACSGRPGEGEEKSALVSHGVVGQKRPRQGTRPSLLRPDRQTEGSKGRERCLASRHGRHRGVPAQVPVVEPGEEGQEGQEVTRGSPVSRGFLLLAFLKVQTLLPPNTRVQLSSAQLELSTSCHRPRHHHLITSTSPPFLNYLCGGCLRCSAERLLPDTVKDRIQKNSVENWY